MTVWRCFRNCSPSSLEHSGRCSDNGRGGEIAAGVAVGPDEGRVVTTGATTMVVSFSLCDLLASGMETPSVLCAFLFFPSFGSTWDLFCLSVWLDLWDEAGAAFGLMEIGSFKTFG